LWLRFAATRFQRHGTDHDSKPLPSFPGFCLRARPLQCGQKEHRSSRATAKGLDRSLLTLPFAGARLQPTRRTALRVHSPVGGLVFRNFCRSQGGVVRGCKTSVCGYSSQRCIGQVANDDSVQLLEFLFRRFVSLNFVICQQLHPAHAVHLSRTANWPSNPVVKK